MAQDRGSQMADADKDCFLNNVPPQERLNCDHQLGYRITYLRLSDDAGKLQILPDLHGNKLQISTDGAAGDQIYAPGAKVYEVVMVLGQPL